MPPKVEKGAGSFSILGQKRMAQWGSKGIVGATCSDTCLILRALFDHFYHCDLYHTSFLYVMRLFSYCHLFLLNHLNSKSSGISIPQILYSVDLSDIVRHVFF